MYENCKLTDCDIALTKKSLIRPGDLFIWKGQNYSVAQYLGSKISRQLDVRRQAWYKKISPEEDPNRRICSFWYNAHLVIQFDWPEKDSPLLFLEFESDHNVYGSTTIFAKFLLDESVFYRPILSYVLADLNTNERVRLTYLLEEEFLKHFSPI